MKLLLIDYSGHLPQADLAEKLSKLGNQVLHLRCTDYVSGTANFERDASNKSSLEFKGLSAGIKLNKYKLFSRLRHELKFSRVLFRELREFDPQFVIISNIPLIGAAIFTRKLLRLRIPYVYWWQDAYSLAISEELKKRVKNPIGGLIEKLLVNIEKSILKNSIYVVAISESFRDLYKKWGLNLEKIGFYPNWTPPEEFEHYQETTSLFDFPYYLYAGTMGLKHNPKLLIDFCDLMLSYDPKLKLVVVSEGLGREYLERSENSRPNLILRNFLPLDELKIALSHSLATLTILEDTASEYSVPSKIMTYFAAGKTMIAFMSDKNQAAKYISSSNSGIVINDRDMSLGVKFAIDIYENANYRKQLEKNAREFAVENFSGMRAANFFLGIMNSHVILSKPE